MQPSQGPQPSQSVETAQPVQSVEPAAPSRQHAPVVYVARNGNADVYWYSKDNMPRNTNFTECNRNVRRASAESWKEAYIKRIKLKFKHIKSPVGLFVCKLILES